MVFITQWDELSFTFFPEGCNCQVKGLPLFTFKLYHRIQNIHKRWFGMFSSQIIDIGGAG